MIEFELTANDIDYDIDTSNIEYDITANDIDFDFES